MVSFSIYTFLMFLNFILQKQHALQFVGDATAPLNTRIHQHAMFGKSLWRAYTRGKPKRKSSIHDTIRIQLHPDHVGTISHPLQEQLQEQQQEQQKYQQLSQELEKLTSSLAEKEEALGAEKKRVTTMTNTITQLQQQLNLHTQQLQHYSKTSQELRKQVRALQGGKGAEHKLYEDLSERAQRLRKEVS